MNRKQLPDAQASNGMMRYEPAHVAAPNQAEEPSANLLADVWRRRWAVLFTAMVFVAGGVAFLRVAPPAFTATSNLYIQAPSSAGAPSASPGGGALSDNFLWTTAAIIQSPGVCGEAAKQLLGPSASASESYDLEKKLEGGLAVDVGRRDSVMSISYTDKTADQAARFANAVTNAYIKYETESRQDSRHEMYKALLAEKAKFQAQLDKARQAEIDYKKEHAELQYNVLGGTNIKFQEVVKLSDALTPAKLALADAVATESAAEAVKGDLPKLQRLAQSQKYVSPLDPEIARTGQMLADAEARLEALSGNLPGHPQVQMNMRVVAELRAKLASLGKSYADDFLAAAHEAHVRAGEQVKAIRAQLDEAERQATLVNAVEGDYAKLENDLQSATKLVDSLTQQTNQLEIQDTTEIPNITVLRPALADDASRSPQPSRILAVMLAAGLLCGAGFAIIRERLDQRVRSAEEIAGILGLPVIGVVPHMKGNLTSLARSQAVHWDPMSEVAEAYRAVRTAVHFGVPAGQAKTIVITSPTPSDGKSTLASNLAITMAQAGKRTLLLDADFRRPVQHKMFEVKDESGLTAVLAGQETLSKGIHRTVVEGLDLLPAGPLPLNPSELLNGDSFAGILEELSQKYDHVVIDCPPVMAVTDARILGAICDISLLVLRAGKTSRKGAELARSGLLSVGSRLLGVIVNDVPRNGEHYGYYGHYSYQSATPSRRRLSEANGEEANGHAGAGKRRRRLPSPSGMDTSMQ